MESDFIEMSLRDVQLAELEILIKFNSICNELHLKYYLYYGTLIGAVRHKGFIPWDDDIDVIMPRQDYEKFLSYTIAYSSKLTPYVVCHYSTDTDYVYPIIRFCNTEYKVEYHDIEGYGQGLFMDIYPFDGCGNNLAQAERYLKRSSFRSMIMSLAGTNTVEKSKKGFLAITLKKILFYYAHMIGANKLAKKYDEICKRKKYEDYEYVAGALWPYYGVKDLAKRADLDETIFVDFEGEKFPAPKKYDIHLRRIYGDYLQLPPPENQIAHHHYTAYRKNNI